MRLAPSYTLSSTSQSSRVGSQEKRRLILRTNSVSKQNAFSDVFVIHGFNWSFETAECSKKESVILSQISCVQDQPLFFPAVMLGISPQKNTNSEETDFILSLYLQYLMSEGMREQTSLTHSFLISNLKDNNYTLQNHCEDLMRQWMTEKCLINYEVLYKYHHDQLLGCALLIFFIFRVLQTEENTINSSVTLHYLWVKIEISWLSRQRHLCSGPCLMVQSHRHPPHTS